MIVSLLALSCATSPQPPPSVIINGPPGMATTGASCSKTSCSFGDDSHDSISEEEFVVLLDQWASEPLGASTLALDTLLFDSARSAALLEAHGDRLTAERRQWLADELARSEVVVEMRLVDEHGDVRGGLASSDFPLREKQHLPFADTGSLGWLETGGKVKRVGLAHLWSRW